MRTGRSNTIGVLFNTYRRCGRDTIRLRACSERHGADPSSETDVPEDSLRAALYAAGLLTAGRKMLLLRRNYDSASNTAACVRNHRILVDIIKPATQKPKQNVVRSFVSLRHRI